MHGIMKWGRLSWSGIQRELEMEVIDDSEPVPLCQDEKPEEVFSVDWRPASDMFWQLNRQLEDRKSALLEYLTRYGPRAFPPFKKRLKRLKKMLKKLENGEQSQDASHCHEKVKLGNFQGLFAEVISQVTVANVRLNQPGLHKFFVEGIGRDVLPSLERRHSCSVEPVCETPPLVVLNDEVEPNSLPEMKEALNNLIPLEDKLQPVLREELLSIADIEEVFQGLNQQEKSPEVVNEEIPPIYWKEKAPNNAVPEIQEPGPLKSLNSWECTCIKNTRIQISVDDLTQQTTDAVLILNNDNLCLTQGGQLNAQIANAAGSSLIEECCAIVTGSGAQLPGEALMTGSGNLPCKHLIHVIMYPGPPQILDLQLSVKKGLQLADAKGLGTIALPAIGAGRMQLSLVDSARVLSGGILSFLERPPQSLREIKVVLFLEAMLWTYSQEMKKEFVPFVTLEEYSPLSRAWDDKDDFIPVLHPPSAVENTIDERNAKNPLATPTEFRVYGKDRRSIMNAVNGLRSVFAKHCTQHRITHKLVPQVTQYSWSLLSGIATQHDVELTIEGYNNAITVRGNSDDVSLVVDRIWQEITRLAEQQTDIERRKLLAQYVRWHCVILGKEIGFNDKVSAIIEDARNRKCNGVNLQVKDCEYRVDFSSMTVLYSRSNYPALRLSRRLVAESGNSSPDFWLRQPCFPEGDPVPVAMVTLNASEGEYQHVANMFYSTGGTGNITSIERVQNLCLYKQYTTYRQQVETMNCRSGFNNQNERQLFHGTKGCNVRAINLQGFNRNFCGMNGAVYGNGVYFATNASYSMTYTRPDSNNLRHMYLARVVVGFYVEGRKGLLVPPPLCPDVPEVLFDSVVNSVNNPTVFVVFRDYQCYPEYLITIRT